MGYEVTYRYHERQKDGKYNMEETKELKKRVGKAFEELPLEKLAAVVMGELARRDIWITDVEVEQFIKKKLNFKESSDGKGIVIKGKKFSFGQSAELIAQDVQVTDADYDPSMAPQAQQRSPGMPGLPAKNNKIPQKWMIYDPPVELIQEAQVKGLAFTQGKKYPVFDSQDMPIGSKDGTPIYGEVLSTRNDKHADVVVSEKYFVPVQKLVGDDEVEGGFGAQVAEASGPRLSYANELTIDVPQQVQQQARAGGGAGMPTLRPGAGAGAMPDEWKNIPVDTGEIPADLAQMPDLGRNVR